MTSGEKKILIIDSNSIIHRAYHALPPLRNKKGEIVNAVYGFFSILIKKVKEIEPSHIVAAFDLPGPTFRHQIFQEYKAKRPPTPQDLINQFTIVKKGLEVLGVCVLAKQGFEADDLIGSLVRMVSRQKNQQSIILSGDKDNLQLIDSATTVSLLQRGIKEAIRYDLAKVKNDYQGLKPSQLIDLKALEGDQSDNISGVPGIGRKTAIDLIKKFHNLEKIYEVIQKNPTEISATTVLKLSNNKNKALMSKKLVTIETEIPLTNFDLNQSLWKGFKNDYFMEFLEEIGFKALIKRLTETTKSNLSLF